MLNIIQGERQPWAMTVRKKNATTGKVTPLDLTGFSEITVCFKTGANIITKLESLAEVTVDSLTLGEISGFLLVADTDGMPTGRGDAEVIVDFGGGDVQKAIILGSHTVTAKICP